VQETFYWHDYETFGADPSKDRPAQFAGLRTDFELNIIGEPLVVYCQPQRDILPAPEACLVTGITPQQALQNGLLEPEFMAQIHQQLSTPNTCGVGYNSIRFDDEVTRYGLYRNFYDPYQREWQNGNSRWDIIDLMRATRALRPEGIEWPDHEPGSPSFKLEHLTAANGIDHAAAHDALSDVTATIAMARLVKQTHPKLFDYVLNNRGKSAVAKIVDLKQRRPFFHCSGMLPRANLYSAIMIPVAPHPTNSNGIICYDLSADPELLINLDADQIKQRIFSAAQDLSEGVERVPLKVVHLNKAPVVSTSKVVDSVVSKRLKIDLQRCEQHWQRLQGVDLEAKLQRVFTAPDFLPREEPEQQLYEGFLANRDRPLLEQIRAASAEEFRQQNFCFSDSRYNKLLFIYRARYFPESLSAQEQAVWLENCRWRLTDSKSGYLTVEQQLSDISNLLSDSNLSDNKRAVLQELQDWTKVVTKQFTVN
jgi:exodeoxyribonuclease-1